MKMNRAQGLAVWGLALALAWSLPGALWRPVPPPPFPAQALLPAALAVLALAVTAPLAAWAGGPRLASRRTLALLEAPPDLLWAGLLLALWPAAWGPPGSGAWILAFLAAALPGEARWLCHALPGERPFPEAWGVQAVRRVRFLALRRLWGRWLAARLPLLAGLNRSCSAFVARMKFRCACSRKNCRQWRRATHRQGAISAPQSISNCTKSSQLRG